MERSRLRLCALLGLTAALYLWGLSASGWANAFYSAAVQAGTHSWKAAFFGASDAAGSITVDKSPLFLWPMEVSARLFGLSPATILVPNAIEGVLSVAVLYAAVKRWFGETAGLLAGAILALTPAAVLMFRFNNPDSMLVLLLTLAGYAMVRALERGETKWVVACFSLVGLGFLAKMMQAFLVVPAFGVAYLLAGPPQLWRRVVQLALGAAAMVMSLAWWIAAVEITPKSFRPYVGGSQNNSVLNLVFGYNGFGRLTGNERGSVGARHTAAGRPAWGQTGLFRMFDRHFGGQASWLMPAALLLLAVVGVVTARRARTDRTRAALVIWGGWLVITTLTFSLGRGIIHEYYTVALAPGIGGTIGVAGIFVWNARRDLWARITMAAATVLTGVWAAVLIGRTPSWLPWLVPAVLGPAALAAAFIVVGPRMTPKVVTAAAAGALAVAFVGPTAYSLDTAATRHEGAIVSAGPAGQGSYRPPSIARPRRVLSKPTAVTLAVGPTGSPIPVLPGGPRHGGLIGGLLEASRPDHQLKTYLLQDADKYRWIAATIGSEAAAGYQLSTGRSVMPMGGFNGTDPSPTLAQFQRYVAHHEIHYYLSTGRGLGGPGTHGGGLGPKTGTSMGIARWIARHFSAVRVGRVTVYDLTSPATT
ncbi:MAG TPA: glycosyltransferase family 39 protein [Acidimicrobiales bacterium]|nr:glycosyltransferase family 39 protein [Acidimicrobiales bacterium]